MNRIDAEVLKEVINMDGVEKDIEYIIKSVTDTEILASKIRKAELSGLDTTKLYCTWENKVRTAVQTIITLHHMAYASLRKGFLSLFDRSDIRICDELLKEITDDITIISKQNTAVIPNCCGMRKTA